MKFALSWAADAIREEHSVPQPAGPFGDVLICRKIDGLWTRLCDEIGWTEAMRKATNKKEFISLINPYGELMMMEMREQFMASGPLSKKDKGADFLFIADDICTSIGWIIDETIVRESLIPIYGKMLTAIGNDLPFSRDEFNIVWGFHSDGDISELYPDLARAGFGAAHLASVSYGRMSTLATKASASSMMTLGGIATETLEAGKISGELARQIAILARRDRFVVCDDGGLQTARQLEHYYEACLQIALC